MTETPEPDSPASETPDEHPKGRLRRFEDAVHDHLLAAEVAAEEAAGYGSLTAAREAAEAAVNPDHELGDGGESAPAEPAAEQPAE
ncbi:MAG TPA: hypothetical protein VI434_01280 [Candidatus Dormibacteraeota bacterium]